MEEAGDVGEVAVLARHPQVAGAGVKDDLEGLGRSADGDGSEVLGVHVVRQGLRLGPSELVAPSVDKETLVMMRGLICVTYLPLKRCMEVSTSLKCLLAVFDLIMGILTRPDSDCSSKSHS